jgi:hypothetical protein
MRGNSAEREPVLEELRAIRGVLQDLLILECARTRMKREDLRAIVAVNNNRISRIARHVKPVGKEPERN